MPAVVWDLKGGTIAVATDTETLGVSNIVRRRRSLARDELTFTHTGAAISSTALFAYGDTITLRRDGVKVFVGVVVEVPRFGNGSGESLRYKAAGTWWYFENLVYQQNWPTAASSAARRASAVLGYNASTEARVNTKTTLQDILDWLIGSVGGAKIQYTAANLPAGISIPFFRMECPTCAEAIQMLLRFQPDAAHWFDYTTTPPTFNLKLRAAASSRSYALTAIDTFDITPRNELKIDRCVVQLVTNSSSGDVVVTNDVDPVGTTGREFGCVVFALLNDYDPPLTAGLAAAYRAGLSTLHYSGQITIVEDACAMDVRPGEVVNITGGLTAWATMNALVQEVTEDIDNGRTTVTLGVPGHLRFEDFVEMMRPVRRAEGDFGTIKKAPRPAIFEAVLTYADITPEDTEIGTAVASAYTSYKPAVGDIVHLTVGGKLKFRCYVQPSNVSSGTGLWVVPFTVSGTTRWVHVVQTGIF
jgi:hypothetical protein